MVDKDGNVTVGAPTVEGAKVVCQVVSNLVKGDKDKEKTNNQANICVIYNIYDVSMIYIIHVLSCIINIYAVNDTYMSLLE